MQYTVINSTFVVFPNFDWKKQFPNFEVAAISTSIPSFPFPSAIPAGLPFTTLPTATAWV